MQLNIVGCALLLLKQAADEQVLLLCYYSMRVLVYDEVRVLAVSAVVLRADNILLV